MKNLKGKVLLVVLSVVLFVGLMVPSATAKDKIKINGDVNIIYGDNGNSSYESQRTIYVYDQDSLIDSIKNSKKGDNVILSCNIYVSKDICLSGDINLDLNGYSIKFKNCACLRICGKDNADIKIKNGFIFGSNGINSSGYKDANDTVVVESGTVSLDSLTIKGGCGVKGGAFGGDGGNALVLRKGTEVVADNVRLYGGDSAKGFLLNGSAGSGLVRSTDYRSETGYERVYDKEKNMWVSQPYERKKYFYTCKICGNYFEVDGHRPFLFFK